MENLILLEALLRYGADANCRDFLEDTPLCLAAWMGFDDSIRILIQYGADFTVNREAMLYCAVGAGHVATVQQIIHYYEDAHETLGPETSLIHASIKSGDAETLKLLIAQGLDINTQDSDGYTPLVLASYFGNLGQLRVLIDCNAYPNIQTYNHMTALDYLEERYESREKVISILLLPGSVRKECTSVEQYFVEVRSIMQKLRQSGAKTWKELYAESKRGNSP